METYEKRTGPLRRWLAENVKIVFDYGTPVPLRQALTGHLGLLPTIGVPLPLMSYGGTALLAAMSGIALILNVNARRCVN